MPLVTASNLSMHFGGPDLLKGVSFDIEPGNKIGLIGQNGTGKSTLLKIITGQLEPVAGEVHRQRNLNVAYQAQELTYDPGATVLDEMRKLFADDVRRQQRLHALEERMADGEDVLAEYERIQHEHEGAGGYEVERKIEQVLTGLGLPESSWQQPIETFSGGERNIIGLARILLQEPDLMLLDEPSNHLDMDGIEWFIQFIRHTRAAVLMVSHNRHMLDATVNEIWDLHGRKLTRWAGNYSDFARQKAEALALQERQYKSQQRLIKRIQFQARRLMDMANAYDDPGQAKRAKAMLKRIDQMDKVDAPDRSENRFHAKLTGGKRHGHLALEIEGLTIEVGARSVSEGAGSGTGNLACAAELSEAENVATKSSRPQAGLPVPRETRALLERAALEITFGQRVALVGPNGSGKTTLFKAILDHADWEHPDLDLTEGPFHIAGRLRTGKSAKIGDYSQIHQHALDESLTLIQWFMNVSGLEFQPATLMLHKFLFSRSDLERTIATLSGGEKSRLQLARLVHEKVNFLMLDEPTNHLDIQACEQLEEMLEEFEGTLLIISHDRYFLDRLVNKVVELKDHKLEPFEGTFAKWWNERHAQAGGARSVSERPGRRSHVPLQLHSQKSAAERRSEAKQQREEQKAKQREQHKLRTELKQLEGRIEKLEAKQKELEEQLALAFSHEGQASAEEAQKLNTAFEAIR
ncbi:MAG: ATP-binding cassette domain-containing protein, partial [Planctomycetes bacterium]|nr:ATP-binding cassette domain-containing protein [Planctomycetota bacterium]